jgi:hypothetical protein
MPSGTGFPFYRFVGFTGLLWRYFNPPPHWGFRVLVLPIYQQKAEAVAPVEAALPKYSEIPHEV